MGKLTYYFKVTFLFNVIIIFTINLSFTQTNESIYALNEGVTTKNVKRGTTIVWEQTKPFPNGSYIKIKNKNDGTYYIQTIVGGQFTYGHYFKYQEMKGKEYKYKRTDGNEEEYLYVNFPLSKLAESNQYDEKVILKMINYRTSFGLLFKF